MARRERLAWDDIRKRFPDSWVVIAEPKLDENDELVDGIVIFSSLDRDDALRSFGANEGETSLEFTGVLEYRKVTILENGINKQAA